MHFLFLGDSFTAGRELLDYKFYDDYPEPVKFDEQNSKFLIEWRKNNSYSLDASTKRQEDERLHSYATKLSVLMNTEYTNLAKSGSSLERCYLELVDFVNHTSHTNITVFIQIPIMERWLDYAKGIWKDYTVRKYYDDALEKDYFKFKIINNTDHSRFIKWYLTLESIRNFCLNNRNIKNHYFINHGVLNHIQSNYNFNDSFFKGYQRLCEKIKSNTFHFPHTKDLNRRSFLPYGHVIEKDHEQLAIDIQSIL